MVVDVESSSRRGRQVAGVPVEINRLTLHTLCFPLWVFPRNRCTKCSASRSYDRSPASFRSPSPRLCSPSVCSSPVAGQSAPATMTSWSRAGRKPAAGRVTAAPCRSTVSDLWSLRVFVYHPEIKAADCSSWTDWREGGSGLAEDVQQIFPPWWNHFTSIPSFKAFSQLSFVV